MNAHSARLSRAAAYRVRDLWAHKDAGVIRSPLSLTAKQLPIHGGVAAYRLSPVTEQVESAA